MKRLDLILSRWHLPLFVLALMGGIAWGYGVSSPWPALLTAAIAAIAMLLYRGTGRALCAFALAFSLGTGLGWLAEHPALPEEGMVHVSGVVSEAVQQRENGQIRTTLRHITLDGHPFPAGAYWSFYQDEVPGGLTPGTHVTFTARLYHPSGAENPGGYDFRQVLLQRNVTIGLYGGQDSLTCDHDVFCLWGLFAGARHRLSEGFCAMLGTEAGAYASAMLLGERTLLPEEDESAFRRLGIAHVLSVSGYHVGVLYALAMGLLSLLRVPVKRRGVIIGLLLGGFCLLTGMHPPVVRASILALMALYGKRLGATPARLHWLAFSALIQLVISPVQLASASFQLTYGALLGITLCTAFLQYYTRRFSRWRRLLDTLAVAAGAQIGILLPELYWFHTLPALGLAANFLVLGVVSVLMTLFWLCLPLMLIPGLSSLAGTAVGYLTTLFAAGIRWTASSAALVLWTRQANLLTAMGWILVLAGMNLLWKHWGRRQAAMTMLGTLLLVLSVIPWPMSGTTYTQLSVGEADTAVLQDDNTVIVIDTGEFSTLAGYLHARRMPVDTLILTHLHADHTSGIAAMLENGIPIRRCVIAAGAKDALVDPMVLEQLDLLTAAGTDLVCMSRGDVIELPHGSITLLWPEDGRVRPNQDANLSSVALRVQLYDTTLLLMGDLDGTYETYAAVPADVLKAAHHGSATATGEAFLSIVQPAVIIQSCGTDNRVQGFRDRTGHDAIYATQSCGAVTVAIDRDGYTVSPYFPQP